jgi:hypothetical protein
MKMLGTLGRLMASGMAVFCVATFLTQLVFIAALWARGFLTQDKVARIQAVFADVDYQQIRSEMRAAARQQEMDPKKLATNVLVQLQETSLVRAVGDNALTESRLRESGRRLEIQEEAFHNKIAGMEAEVLKQTRNQLVRTMKNMAAEQLKANLAKMAFDGGMTDVLAIVRQLNAAEQTKVFSEFQSDEDRVILHDILQQMRQSQNAK